MTTIMRFAREGMCQDGKEKEHATALAEVARQIPRIRLARHLYKQERLKFGRALIALKRTVHHGLWEDCYQRHYGRSGVPFNRAQRCMRSADKKGVRRLRGAAERGSPAAKQRRESSRQKKLEEAHRRERKSQLDKNFKLLTSELIRKPEWDVYLGELANGLRGMFVKHGISYPETVNLIEIEVHEPTPEPVNVVEVDAHEPAPA
jgi:hypothetical protein